MSMIDSTGRTRREAILDAAAKLVREHGAAHLTLDAVSARARVSKGGLLYHFRTKESLLAAMVARLAGALAEAREQESAKLPPSPGAALKAQVRAMQVFRKGNVRPIAAALLAAGAHDPRLLKQAAQNRRATIRKLESAGIPPAFIRVILCAVEGLILSETIGLAVYSRAEHRAFIDELLQLIDVEEARRCR